MVEAAAYAVIEATVYVMVIATFVGALSGLLDQ